MPTTKIKCPVEGVIELDRLPGVPADKVRALIDSPELQRLRHVRQLGFTEMVYPGATHSRFGHSLGAYQGAQRTILQLQAAGARIPDEWFVATTLACLLHDVGHGPFSHAYEAVSGTSHEARTLQIVESGPRVPQALEAIGVGTQARVLQLLRGNVEDREVAFLADLVSSALDCDRMDYLRRDALFTGASYGAFDRDWIIREIVPTEDRTAIVLVEKGRSAAEQYLIGRYHMFQNVYLHKTSRGFETAFRQLCLRMRALQGPRLGGGTGAADARLFAADLPLAEFLQLTDIAYLAELRGLVGHADATVRTLARALVWRRPLCCSTSTGDVAEVAQLLAQRQREAAARGLDPAFAVWRDEAEDVPYRPYSPLEGRKGLRVRSHAGELVDVTQLSPTLAALSARLVLHRVYWLAEPESA
jgi:HD superfamily phosphohydrolase